MHDIPLWTADREKITKLGKGAAAANVDKAFGRSRILWSKKVEVTGTIYLFRLYDSVESAPVNREPYAVVFVGAEPRLQAWGTLAQLRDSDDSVVVSMLPELTSRYTQYRMTGG
jgi:hypothetical protein